MVALVRAPFYFINLLQTSILYISILLTTCTSRMTYEWSDNGMKRVTAWSKAVRDAMLKGGAEFQRQKVLKRAAGN